MSLWCRLFGHWEVYSDHHPECEVKNNPNHLDGEYGICVYSTEVTVQKVYTPEGIHIHDIKEKKHVWVKPVGPKKCRRCNVLLE